MIATAAHWLKLLIGACLLIWAGWFLVTHATQAANVIATIVNAIKAFFTTLFSRAL